MALSLKLDKIYNNSNNNHWQIFYAVVDNFKGVFNSLYTALYLMTIIIIPHYEVAYYGKGQICNYRAPNLDSNTLDIYKELLLKTFFDSVQKDPSQEQFTFRTQ